MAGIMCAVNFYRVDDEQAVSEVFAYLISGVNWDQKPGTGLAVIARLVGDGPEMRPAMFLDDGGPAAAAKQAEEALKLHHRGLKAIVSCRPA